MPELPDLVVYLEALERRVLGAPLERLQLLDPFVLRSVSPTPDEVAGRRVTGLERLGKRLVLVLEGELFAVVHLMVAGRLRWRPRSRRPGRRAALAVLDFPSGSIWLTEAGSTRRAWLRLVRGEAELAALDPGGLEVPGSDQTAFAERLRREAHTLKRALTDPRLLAGIGNAYSDEILHRAFLSPFRLTTALSDEELARLHRAAVGVLAAWVERLRGETGDAFPERVTAFREGMAVHGRFGQPCPVCGSPVQRVVYAANEANYCAHCQTGGRLLADRSLSRLLKQDWPRTLDELEERRARHG